MSDETGTPARVSDSDQFVAEIGTKVRDMLSRVGILPEIGDTPVATDVDIGRMLHAFIHIRDPRIRTEFVSLIEALKSFSSR